MFAGPMALFSILAGALRVTIDSELAGRVLGLSFAHRELFVGPDVNAANFGSTYWTSPQSAWGWPPLAAIDQAPFDVVSESPLTLRGPEAIVDGRKVRLTKVFKPVAGQSALDVEYRLENLDSRSMNVAGWEISRVEPRGLTFYPTGQVELTPVPPHGTLALHREHGWSFFDHASFELGRSAKVHADGELGVLAHVTAANARGERVLFLKLFEDTSPASHAPGEGEVEIFANEDGAYVEVEVQGAHEEIPPGQEQVFHVRWLLAAVPSDVVVEPGSRSLIEFVERTMSEARG